MLKPGSKSIIYIIALFALFACIEPYVPDLKGYDSIMVVDGLITDANTPYTVRLSRTFQEQNADPLMVSDATVFITDDVGSSSYLINSGKGIYKTDSLEFKGIPGRTYILHVRTSEGEEYESAPCLMQSVPDIGSIYFEKDQAYFNNSTELSDGITIYIDSKGSDNNKYYRWEYDEDWKFKLPDAKEFDFISWKEIVQITHPKDVCYKSNKSTEVIIDQVYSYQPSKITKEPILFIASDKSDRLIVRYSILVKQYSVSKSEFDFWNNIKQIDNIGGDIFAAQPFPVISNIRNIKNSNEKVMGYFQVSAMKHKRFYIGLDDIVKLDLPYYHYPCTRKEDSPDLPPWNNFKPPLSWEDLYNMYTTSGWEFIAPIYDGLDPSSKLYRLVFAKPECANCELTGKLAKPEFWIDSN